jgi:hypothetical protein
MNKICPICKLNVPYLVHCSLCSSNGNFECLCLYCRYDNLTHNKKLNCETKMVYYINKIIKTDDKRKKLLYKQEFEKNKKEYEDHKKRSPFERS